MIAINNLTTTETDLEELDLSTDADCEGYLQDLSEQDEINIKGGYAVVWAV